MPTIRFELLAYVSYRTWSMSKRTPSEWGILSYLRLRQVEGQGPATREEILIESGLSERTVDGVLRKLRRQAEIRRIESWEALPWAQLAGD